MTAFVLGNGQSRRDIDINILLSVGTVYGCNALYRTHAPHVLVATDRPISEEIQRSGYALKNKFFTRRPLPDTGAMIVPEEYFGFSSGPIATALAAKDGHARIYLLGFDMGPTPDGRFNNVYADTEFYKKSTSSPTFTGNWTRQICQIARDFPDQQFVRVHGATTADVPSFSEHKNLTKLGIIDFVERINNPKDL
jgi:hypothetical protein